MPKLWTDTIETHKHDVRDAIVDAAATLVARNGLLAVTMASIAEQTGIGRATLYKYFSGVEDILSAWHERQVRSHFKQLVEISKQGAPPRERLEAVLETYALIAHQTRGHQDTDLAAFLHRNKHIAQAHKHLKDLVKNLITEAAKAGDIRGDVAADELSNYCLHALAAAASLPSKTAVRRLIIVTMAGLTIGLSGHQNHNSLSAAKRRSTK